VKIGKLQIGPVKYDEIEGMILANALLLGFLIGLPSGIITNYMLGFPTVPSPEQPPTDFLGWTTLSFVVIMSIESLSLLITTGLCVLLLKKYEAKYSVKTVGKFLLAIFVFFPVLVIYVALVFSAVIVPFNYAFPWLGFVKIFWIGALLLLPFMILFGAIIMPESPAGKFLRRLIRKLRR